MDRFGPLECEHVTLSYMALGILTIIFYLKYLFGTAFKVKRLFDFTLMSSFTVTNLEMCSDHNLEIFDSQKVNFVSVKNINRRNRE